MPGLTHIAVLVGTSLVAAEFLGYLLHRLMHSGWIPWLSVSHMKHHMVLYGPLQKQRPSHHYMDATTGAIAIRNIGLEWIIPSGCILVIALTIFGLVKAPVVDQLVSITTIVGWSFLMFSYLHDSMHVKGFWMEHTPIVRCWFLRARRFHDVHHHALNDDGLIDKNFGIGFFAFDRIFGTLARNAVPFNHEGYSVAQRKFCKLYRETSPSR